MRLLSLFALVLTTLPLLGNDYTVVNRMPRQGFTVVNKCSEVAYVTRTVTTTRAPVGHTHTCVNGHTWDHQANAGHRCLLCGVTQLVQDRFSRPVTVVQAVRVPAQQTQATAPAPATYQPASIVQYSKYQQKSNCPNGNCPYVR